ncbi:MAG: hypothetical protein LBM02_08130 [Lachnospiraceae bacterium]|jgi:hypothetical protein|nr:hypothetical protein [Lachnospiraceae bacterium]
MPTIDEIREENAELMKTVIANCIIMGSQGFHLRYRNSGKDYLVSLNITETDYDIEKI